MCYDCQLVDSGYFLARKWGGITSCGPDVKVCRVCGILRINPTEYHEAWARQVQKERTEQRKEGE
jgi:hypothetical protein